MTWEWCSVHKLYFCRVISLPTKVHIVKDTVFPAVMYGCESWTIKKTEHWRIDAFELWCWKRLLWVPRTAKKSNQLILKEINPDYSSGDFGHLMQRTDSLEKTLMLGKIEGGRRRGRQRPKWFTDSMDRVWASSRSWWRTGKPGMLQSMESQRVWHNWVTEHQQEMETCIKYPGINFS